MSRRLQAALRLYGPIPATNLGLSKRAKNCLDSAGIKTVLDLCGCSRWRLLKVKNLGKATLAEIEAALGEFGLGILPEPTELEVAQFQRCYRWVQDARPAPPPFRKCTWEARKRSMECFKRG